MVALSMVQNTVMILAAPDFLHFMFGHFVVRAIAVFDRLYLNACIQTCVEALLKWKRILGSRLRKSERFTREQKQAEELEKKKIKESIELKGEAIEMLIGMYDLYSIETTGCLLAPLISALLALFFKETQMPAKLRIPQNELVYCACFHLVMIPWKTAVDVIVLNSQELLNGWRVYDFIAYLMHRFSIREQKWALYSTTVDASLSEQLQTQNKLCFSSQYYFLLATFSLGIINTLLGLVIVLRTPQYNVFGDPVMPGILVGLYALFELIRTILQKISDLKVPYFGWYGLWDVISCDSAIVNDICFRMNVGTGKKQDFYKEKIEIESLNSELFRHLFLQKKNALGFCSI